MKAKKTRYLIILLILTIIITFCSFSCTPSGPAKQTIEETAQETAEEIAVEEPEEEPAEEVVADEPVEEPTEANEENEKENINKFFEQIKEYDILVKNFDYSLMTVEALSDWADGKISQEDVGSRYMEITSKVRNDYFIFDILFTIGESSLEKEGIIVTDDMERVIELISSWKDKKERYYKYMANYYYRDGPEYEIEADKIEEELDEITDEYLKLTNEMAKKAKTD